MRQSSLGVGRRNSSHIFQPAEPNAIVRADLEGPVSRALGTTQVEILDWQIKSIHAPFNRSTSALLRVSGTARLDAASMRAVKPWSIILKILTASEPAYFSQRRDASDPNFWRRELLIYRSGILESLPGLRAPRFLGDSERGDRAGIWLEDLPSSQLTRWSESTYRNAGRQLGIFNGTYAAGRELPERRFLSRDWLRKSLESYGSELRRMQQLREHPVIRRCLPDDLNARLQRLWRDRHSLFASLDRLPRTFCHNDAYPRNLPIDERNGEIVAIDWAFAGIGPLGSELAPMVAASVIFGDAEPEDAAAIEASTIDGYLEGLNASGFDADERQVRFAAAVSAALRYALFPVGLSLIDEKSRTRFARALGQDAKNIAERWPKLVRFLCDRVDKARQLNAV